MKLATRLALTLFLLGIGLVVAAEITPVSAATSSSSGIVVSGTYFLVPTTIAISISSLNNPARLTVAPLSSNLDVGQAFVNVSVVSKDIVTFPITSRGYYVIQFASSTGTPIALDYTISESGVPGDVIFLGAIIAVVGGVAFSYLFWINDRRQHR